ncbi:MAG TPA: DUF3313 domain-containing protein [Nitrospirota bacterium]|nr:DUF3313 domain-containing protein [Nitrospirota bacterium]
MKKLIIVFIGLMFLAGCATTTPIKYDGVFVPKELVHKFGPGADEHTLSWIRPGVDFSKYKKVMVDYVIFALAPDSEYKGINADEMKKLADAASKALVDALAEKFPIVSEPGPDVVRIKFAISDLKQSRPAVGVITTVLPVGLGINLVQKGATGEWSGAGLTKGEVMFFDSITNEVIAAGYGDYSAKFTARYTKWGSVEDAFKKWGHQIATTYTRLTTETPKKEM